MRKQTIFIVIFCLLMLNMIGCKNKFDEKEFLTKILNNIEQVKSASYFYTVTTSAPYDTMPYRTNKWYVKTFSNPADTAFGVSFGWFYPTDTAKMYRFYDGNASAYIDDDIKIISIDSFKVNRPYRPISSFFNSTKNIIQYALTSNDSMTTAFHDFGDSLRFQLTIYSDKQVLLFYKRPVYSNYRTLPGDEVSEHEISKYDIWVNKTTGLPYKFRAMWTNITGWEECSDIQINKIDIKDFFPVRYFPADYDISVVGQGIQTPPEYNLMEKTAPDWTLTDYNNESFALKDFKSKVLMIKFAGTGCPHCYASLPFLKQLITDYKDKSFELVSIESWSDNIEGIKRFCLQNDITYKYLIISEEVKKQYNPTGIAPLFFILDNNKVVQKVIRGYSPETTDKEIKEAIDKLL